MSGTHFVKKPAMSMLKMAVCEKAWMSPIQPRRSSRCGQSVGTLIMLRPLRPLDAVHDLVEQFVGALEPARARRGGVEHAADNGVLGRAGSGRPVTST